MVVRTVVFILALIGCCFGSIAQQPANVLVGDLHFPRPDRWLWDPPPENSSAVTRYVVPDGFGDTSSTSVRFYFTVRNAPSALEAWKKWFPNDKQSGVTDEESINGRFVTIHRLSGTYVFAGNPPKRNFAMIGAVIPSQTKYIHVILLGPAVNVENARSAFNRMLDEALADAP